METFIGAPPENSNKLHISKQSPKRVTVIDDDDDDNDDDGTKKDVKPTKRARTSDGLVFTCDVCQQMFPSLVDLNTHARLHQKKHPCDKCGLSYAHPGQLKMHRRVHTQYNRVACDQCGKVFGGSRALGIHKRVHIVPRRAVSCPHCHLSFKQQGHLASHLRTHGVVVTSSHKSSRCKDCGKILCDAASLNRHRRIHTGETPYRCGECGQRFRHAGSLSFHMRDHPVPKGFQCEQCPRRFARAGFRDKHVKRAHPSTSSSGAAGGSPTTVVVVDVDEESDVDQESRDAAEKLSRNENENLGVLFAAGVLLSISTRLPAV